MRKGIFLILMLFFLLEGSLQLVAVYHKHQNLKHNQKKEGLTILALGESTTAEYMSEGEKSSWPYQLEKLLRDKGHKVNVINLGLPGTNSIFILKELEGNLKKYTPDIVITMMGINDPDYFSYKDSSLDFLKTVRLLSWIKMVLYHSVEKKPVFKNEEMEPEKKSELLVSLKKFGEDKLLRELDKLSSKEQALRYFEIGKMKIGDLSDLSKTSKEAYPFFKKAFSLYPYHEGIAFYFLFSSRFALTREENKKDCEKVLALNMDFPPLILHQFILVYDLGGPVATFLEEYGVVKEGQPIQGKHYLALNKVLSKNNIYHVAMQYPTLPLIALKEKFSSLKKSPAFVSNENFNSLINKDSYGTYFIDRFQQNWGHTTDQGHLEIAKNALPVVEKVILERSQRLDNGQAND